MFPRKSSSFSCRKNISFAIWSIEGVAWATVLSFLVGDCVALVWLWRHRRDFGLSEDWKVSWNDVMDLGSDGLNLAGRTGILTLSFFIITMFATRLGTTVVAAYQVALQAWLLAAYCMDGLTITTTSLGAQLLGKGDHGAHRLLAQWLVNLGLGVEISFFIGPPKRGYRVFLQTALRS